MKGLAFFAIICSLFVLLSCPDNPPPPPPPCTLECDPGCLLNEELCECICPPPPPPICEGLVCAPECTLNEDTCECECPAPPPVGEKRYFELSKVGVPPDGNDCDVATLMMRDLCFLRHYELIWEGYRNPAFALLNCKDNLGVIGVTEFELTRYIVEGDELIGEADKFLYRLPIEHEDWPGRSMVRKTVYNDFYARALAHMEKGRAFNAKTQLDPCRETKEYDNLRGWCAKCYQ